MENKIEKLFTLIISLAVISSLSLASLTMGGISTTVDNTSVSTPSLSAQEIFWPTNSSDWIEVAPETQGLDSDKIAEMFEYIEMRSYDIRSVIIVRNGYLLTEKYLYNSQLTENKSYFGGNKTWDQWSTTKSLMSILIGIALQIGFLDNLSQTLYEFFANIWEPEFINSTLKRTITIEQLLTMNSGLVGDEHPSFPPDAEAKIADDWIKFALDEVPLGAPPGQTGYWAYSNEGPTILSGIITNVSGMSTEEFAHEYLFTPLGISEDEYDWWHDAQNISYGGYGFACSPKVQAKLGILCMNNGTWNGTQIVGEDYIRDATTNQIFGGKAGNYGYLFYTNGPYEGYYTVGAAGQYIYVIPKFNITIGFAGIFWGSYEYLVETFIVQFAADNAPDWDQIPEDQLLQEGDSLIYDVNASDTSGVEYSINDNINFNISPEGIITNSSSLSADVYPLEISAYNTFNNNITATINIIVESIPSSTAIPGFDFNMIFLMVFCTSVVLIIRRKKYFKNL